jgi:hypothetical protein
MQNVLELEGHFELPILPMHYSLRPANYEDRAAIETSRLRRAPWLLSLRWLSVTSDDCTLQKSRLS